MAEIIFGDYVPEAKENPYAAIVQQLADLNDEKKSVTLVADVNEASKDQFRFQRAANDINKTARLRLKDESDVRVVGTDEDGNEVKAGTVKMIFTLTKMHQGRRTKKPVVENGETTDETPSDEEIAEVIDAEEAKPRKR